LQSNRAVNDSDTGVVELGGGFLTLKGRKHAQRYCFVNLQTAMAAERDVGFNSKTDTEYYTRGQVNQP
jgi:hypothetical protein